MKKIELPVRKGKTYRCLKRALKLVKKGKNVIYITPYGMNHAHELSLDFRDKINGKINYDCFPMLVYKEELVGYKDSEGKKHYYKDEWRKLNEIQGIRT